MSDDVEVQLSNLGVVEPGSLIRIAVPDAEDGHRAMVERLRAEIIRTAGHDQFTVVVTCDPSSIDLLLPSPDPTMEQQ